MQLLIYHESLDEWVHRAFNSANSKNPSLTIKDLEPLSGWIFTEGLGEYSLRHKVRAANCSGLTEAVGLAWTLSGGQISRPNNQEDSWSTEGVVGVVKKRLNAEEAIDDDNWSTVATLGVVS